ncbi:MAG: hypothetical protein KC414_12815 [Romboutsia sp.]|nr:hypothetical protein [Romboutsia sp.]
MEAIIQQRCQCQNPIILSEEVRERIDKKVEQHSDKIDEFQKKYSTDIFDDEADDLIIKCNDKVIYEPNGTPDSGETQKLKEEFFTEVMSIQSIIYDSLDEQDKIIYIYINLIDLCYEKNPNYVDIFFEHFLKNIPKDTIIRAIFDVFNVFSSFRCTFKRYDNIGARQLSVRNFMFKLSNYEKDSKHYENKVERDIVIGKEETIKKIYNSLEDLLR